MILLRMDHIPTSGPSVKKRREGDMCSLEHTRILCNGYTSTRVTRVYTPDEQITSSNHPR